LKRQEPGGWWSGGFERIKKVCLGGVSDNQTHCWGADPIFGWGKGSVSRRPGQCPLRRGFCRPYEALIESTKQQGSMGNPRAKNESRIMGRTYSYRIQDRGKIERKWVFLLDLSRGLERGFQLSKDGE